MVTGEVHAGVMKEVNLITLLSCIQPMSNLALPETLDPSHSLHSRGQRRTICRTKYLKSE